MIHIKNYKCCKPCVINGNLFYIGATVPDSMLITAAVRPLLSMGYIKLLPEAANPDPAASDVEARQICDDNFDASETPSGERRRGNRKKG